MQNSTDSDLLDSCSSSISSMSMLDNTSDDTLTPESVTGEVLSESTKQLRAELRAKNNVLTDTCAQIASIKVQQVTTRMPIEVVADHVKLKEARKQSVASVAESQDESLYRFTEDEKYLSSIRENEGIRLQLEAISQSVESKDQELVGLIREKERIRAKEEQRVRNAHQSRKKCTRCVEYVAQIVNLRKEYKQKKRALKQERERLQSQLDANRSTIHLWENAIEQEKEKNKNALRGLEDKFKASKENFLCERQQQMTIMQEKISDLMYENQQLRYENNLQIALKIGIENELQQEITRLHERTNDLQTENESLIRAIIELEKRSKNAEECILQEGEVEKKEMHEKIKAQAEKIEELEQMFKDSDERVHDLMEENEHVTHENNFQLKTRCDLENELQQEITTLHKKTNDLQTENESLVGVVDELEKMVEQRTNALESAQRRIANQRKIHDDMVNRSNELEDQVEQQEDALDAVNAELIIVRDAARTQINNLHLFIGALQHLVNQFRRRLQDFEYREQNDLALRDELLEILDDLQGQPNRPPNVPNIIFALHVEDEVHIPD